MGARWYGTLLISPLFAAIVLFALSLVSPSFVPGIVTSNDKAALLVFGLVGGLAAGFFEELGWTGFAVPKLRLRHSVLVTGLMVGLLWGAWLRRACSGMRYSRWPYGVWLGWSLWQRGVDSCDDPSRSE